MARVGLIIGRGRLDVAFVPTGVDQSRRLIVPAWLVGGWPSCAWLTIATHMTAIPARSSRSSASRGEAILIVSSTLTAGPPVMATVAELAFASRALAAIEDRADDEQDDAREATHGDHWHVLPSGLRGAPCSWRAAGSGCCAIDGSGPSGALDGIRPQRSAASHAALGRRPFRIVHSIGTVAAPGGPLVAAPSVGCDPRALSMRVALATPTS